MLAVAQAYNMVPQMRQLLVHLLFFAHFAWQSATVSECDQLYQTVKALADLGPAYRFEANSDPRPHFDHSTVNTENDDSRNEDKSQQIESTEGYEI